ncbi:MAG: hypothetical protein GC193_08860 [Cryomorphaceae bacterium]|nr:hypothetical protein [Cryomorphaceae bacterium]
MIRTVAYLMMLWYTVLATGFTVHLHYCCGKLAEIGFNVVNHSGCEDVHNDCSHDHAENSFSQTCCTFNDFYVGIDADHIPEVFAFVKLETRTCALFNDEAIDVVTQKPQATVFKTGPPDYIKYKQLITYG